MIDAIRKRFPNVLSIVDGAAFKKDLNEFAKIAIADNPKETVSLLKSSMLKAKMLLQNLYGEICDRVFSYAASDLERDLCFLRTKFSVADLRAAFAEKLLDSRFYNTLTEVSVTVVMSEVLDDGSIEFEKPLPGSKKNPDITGRWDGETIIAEVTTINIDFPPLDDSDLQNIITEADFSAGFDVWLRVPIVSSDRAKRIRRILEVLFSARLTIEDKVEAEGIVFDREPNDSYKTDDLESPIRHVAFYVDLPESRTVQGGVFTVSISSRRDEAYLEEEYPPPPAVVPVRFGDANDGSSHRSNPFSMAIRDTMNSKLSQCDDAAINIVVLGVPVPMFDIDVTNALYGTYSITLEHRPHAQGAPPLGDPQGVRVPGGIFRPMSESVSGLQEGEQPIAEDNIRLYSSISGVLLFRVGANQPRAEYLPNHNARKPLSSEQVTALVDAARHKVNRVTIDIE